MIALGVFRVQKMVKHAIKRNYSPLHIRRNLIVNSCTF